MAYIISNEISPVENIINRINLIRLQNELNQQQLARHLGISQPAVSKYLKNRIPPAEILFKLARLGATTVEWLLTGKKEHFVMENNLVNEDSGGYSSDIDMHLARKIAALGTKEKDTLIKLLDILEK